MLPQPLLSYAAEFWSSYWRVSSTLLRLVRHLFSKTTILNTSFCERPQHAYYSPYLEPDIWTSSPTRNDTFSLFDPRTPQPRARMNESHLWPLDLSMETPSLSQPRRPRPKQRPNSIAVDTVFAMNGASAARRPPPVEHLPGSPSHRVSFDSPQPPSASPTKSAHMRSQSVIDSPRRLNRLSMSFPVLPPTAGSSRPTSWANSPVLSPAEPSPSAEGNFLTQLASQERKVLELKEALRQAEAELDRLKRHWASHEALKKRADVRRVQALQPLSANLSSLETSEDDVDGSSQWLQKEMERRKALLSGIKTSNRKVFSGSKHTRTLSLLSPEKTQFSQPFPQPIDLRRSEENPYRSPTHEHIMAANARADTLSQLEGNDQPKDVIIRTGKQMASDIKDGLWTFFEDIRQATIGEEATMAHEANSTPTATTKTKPLRRSNTTGTHSSRSTKGASASRPSNKRTTSNASAAGTERDTRHDTLIDIGGSFWREHGVEEATAPPSIPASTKQQPKQLSSSSSQAPPHKKAQSLKSVGVSQQRLSKQSDAGVSSAPNGESETEPAEPWDTWDTPVKDQRTPSSSRAIPRDVDENSEMESASDGINTPLTDEHSRQTPRTSTSSQGKRNSIPWPDLEKLTPSSLKRTASHLMKEWERTMTPSPSPSEIEGLAYADTPDLGLGLGSSVMSSKTDKSD